MKSEGKFIVLDGTDGAGKTVQLELLRKKLSEQDFNFSKELPFQEPIPVEDRLSEWLNNMDVRSYIYMNKSLINKGLTKNFS